MQVRRSIKLLVWLLAGAGTLLAVLVALLFFIDVNAYRTQIEQHVSTAFGRDVVLEGPLGLEPSLTPRFVVGGLKISNPAWASRPFLAKVEKFDIRVSLLPLLRGELKIDSLEFHGVDLLLEQAADGANNFSFGSSGETTVLPAIEHMALYDAAIAFRQPGGTVRRVYLAQVSARKVPGEPVELEAHTTVNSVPVTVSLHGEPPDDSLPRNPWHIALLGEVGDLSLQIEGTVADPTDWTEGQYRLTLKGRHLDDLAALSGYPLPAVEPIELGAAIRFKLDEYFTIGDLTTRLGASDIKGQLHWDLGAPRPLIKAQLESKQLDTRQWAVADSPTRDFEQAHTDLLDQPLPLGTLGAVDLDVGVRVQRLTGLEKTVQDIVLTAEANRERLGVALAKATVADTYIEARAELPWGERLETLGSETVTIKALLQHAELAVRAQTADAIHRYATSLMGDPFDFVLSAVEAKAQPGVPFTIRAEAALNEEPVTVDLQGEPLAALLQRPDGPWEQLELELRSEDIRLDASGSVARPFDAEGFDVSFATSGPDIGFLLPLRGAWSLAGRYTSHPDRHVFDKLHISVGRSDIGGRVVVHQDADRTRVAATLDAGRIHVDDILPDTGGTSGGDGWDRPIEIGGLGAVDLDVEVRVRRLDGLAKPLTDILLAAHTGGQRLTLAPARATVEGTRLDARLRLPWGDRLATLENNGVSVQRLVQHAELALKAQVPEGKLRYNTVLIGHPVQLELASLEASAAPGEAVQLSAKAKLDDKPLRVSLRAEPLADLLQRPTGPWQDLAAEVQGGDMSIEATGSVARPFEARGFDIRYALRGAEIAALLPLFDLVLPLEGAYSLTGHFADLPDRAVFDDLNISSGGSDIAGRISVYQGQQRPRVVADLSSEQIYLSKLLPVSETQADADAERRVIPDYNLPIERMREIDGELQFKGKRLRTVAGDLGDVSFNISLKDGVLSMDSFRVRGWAGAAIEADGQIDASQDPPLMTWRWTGRELNYGVLLEQAGFAETVEGTLDVTLRLSGKGRTRREYLGDASGQLIVVGQEGRFGSRRLDLWGSDLVTTMLSREWRREDVTELNCLVARINIEAGVASSDELLVDTQRITIGAAGTLDLESEKLNLVFAPRPKRASLVSLTSPVNVTGTLAAPEVAVTVLPRNRMAAAGGGLLAGLINPGYLIFTFSQTGAGQANTCAAAIEQAMALKGRVDELDAPPAAAPPRRFSFLPGCTRSARRTGE